MEEKNLFFKPNNKSEVYSNIPSELFSLSPSPFSNIFSKLDSSHKVSQGSYFGVEGKNQKDVGNLFVGASKPFDKLFEVSAISPENTNKNSNIFGLAINKQENPIFSSKKQAKVDKKKLRIEYDEDLGSKELKTIVENLKLPMIEYFSSISNVLLPVVKKKLEYLFHHNSITVNNWNLKMSISRETKTGSLENVLKILSNIEECIYVLLKSVSQINHNILSIEEENTLADLLKLIKNSIVDKGTILIKSSILEVLCFSVFFSDYIEITIEEDNMMLNQSGELEGEWINLFSLLSHHFFLKELRLCFKKNAGLRIIGAFFKLLSSITRSLIFSFELSNDQEFLHEIFETLLAINFSTSRLMNLDFNLGNIKANDDILNVNINNSSNNFKFNNLNEQKSLVDFVKIAIKFGNIDKVKTMNIYVKELDESIIQGLQFMMPYFDMKIIIENFTLTEAKMAHLSEIDRIINETRSICQKNIEVHFSTSVYSLKKKTFKILLTGSYDEKEKQYINLLDFIMNKMASLELYMEMVPPYDFIRGYNSLQENLLNFKNVSKLIIYFTEGSHQDILFLLSVVLKNLNMGLLFLELKTGNNDQTITAFLDGGRVKQVYFALEFFENHWPKLAETEKLFSVIANSNIPIESMSLKLKISPPMVYCNDINGLLIRAQQIIPSLNCLIICCFNTYANIKPNLLILFDIIRKRALTPKFFFEFKSECTKVIFCNERNLLYFDGECNIFNLSTLSNIIKYIESPLRRIALKFTQGAANSITFLSNLIKSISLSSVLFLNSFEFSVINVLEINTDKNTYIISPSPCNSFDMTRLFFHCLETIVKNNSRIYPNINIQFYFKEVTHLEKRFWSLLKIYVKKEYKIDFNAIFNRASKDFIKNCITWIPSLDNVTVNCITRGIIFTKKEGKDKMFFSKRESDYKGLISFLEISKFCNNLSELNFCCDLTSNDSRPSISHLFMYIKDFYLNFTSLKSVNIQIAIDKFIDVPELMTSMFPHEGQMDIQLTLEINGKNELNYNSECTAKYFKDLFKFYFSGYTITSLEMEEDHKNNVVKGFYIGQGSVLKRRSLALNFNGMQTEVQNSIIDSIIDETNPKVLDKVHLHFSRFSTLHEMICPLDNIQDLTLICKNEEVLKFININLKNFSRLHHLQLIFCITLNSSLDPLRNSIITLPNIISCIVIERTSENYRYQNMVHYLKTRLLNKTWALKSRLKSIFTRRLIRMSVIEFLVYD